MLYRLVVAATALAMLSACSSVIDGTWQEIVVDTDPPGADCMLLRENMSIARVSPTPGLATVKRTKHDIVVECRMDGYETASYFNKSAFSSATVGSIILSGGIAWAIDSASGADNEYTSPVHIILVPVGSTPPVDTVDPQLSAPVQAMSPAAPTK